MVRAIHIPILFVCLYVAPWAMSQTSETDRHIATYQARLAKFPNDPSNYDKLGAAYLQKGRETSDFTYYDLAEKALSKSLELTSSLDMSAADPLTHLAAVFMAEHRFRDAAACAERALGLGSGDLSPFALLGDAYADMGEYDKAEASYAKLSLPGRPQEQMRGLEYMHDSRVSYLKFLSGDVAMAIQLNQNAAKLAIEGRMPPENIAWTFFQLGEEWFRAGDLVHAETAYQQALAHYPGFYRGLEGLAKVRVAQLKYQEGIQLYKDAIAKVPFPEYIAALGDIYTKLGRRGEAKQQYDLVEYIGYLNGLNQRAYNRELASFYADHGLKLPEAVALARRELENRQDIYTWDVVAWCLYKDRKVQEAASAMEKALRMGTKDPLLLFHAGMIYMDLGNYARAAEFLSRSLAINPHFHIFYSDVAAHALQQLRSKQTVASKDGKKD